jgi:hypothetical protein
MSKLPGLLDYFNGRSEDEWKNDSKDITVDKEKLRDLVIELGIMRTVLGAGRAR